MRGGDNSKINGLHVMPLSYTVQQGEILMESRTTGWPKGAKPIEQLTIEYM